MRKLHLIEESILLRLEWPADRVQGTYRAPEIPVSVEPVRNTTQPSRSLA